MIYILNKDNKQIATHNMKFEEYFISLSQFLEEPKKYFSDWKEGYIATLYPPRSLGDYQNDNLEELKNKRIELDESPILFKNKNIYKIDEEKGTVEITGTENVLIDADFKSKLMIEIAERRLSENEFEMWKCADNIHRLFSKNELKEVFNKIADRTRELFIKEATLSYQVKNSENIEELDKITWEV